MVLGCLGEEEIPPCRIEPGYMKGGKGKDAIQDIPCVEANLRYEDTPEITDLRLSSECGGGRDSPVMQKLELEVGWSGRRGR